jgi:hypothetical protein
MDHRATGQKTKYSRQQFKRSKINYTGDYTFHLFCKVEYNSTRVNLNIRRLVYRMFVDEKLDEKDKTYWVVSAKDGNGLNCQSSNLELIHVQQRINRSLAEKRNVVPVYKTSEKRECCMDKQQI